MILQTDCDRPNPLLRQSSAHYRRSLLPVHSIQPLCFVFHFDCLAAMTQENNCRLNSFVISLLQNNYNTVTNY